MKKLFISTIVLCLFVHEVFSQSVSITPNGNDEILISRASSTPSFVGRRNSGTNTTPTATISGVELGTFSARGYTGTGYNTTDRGKVSFFSTEAFTASAGGTSIGFYTTPNGTLALTERMRINDAGKVGIGTTTPTGRFQITHGGSDSDPHFKVETNDGFASRVTWATTTNSNTWTAQSYIESATASSNYWRLEYNSSPQIYLRGDGNFGIGTSVPTKKLHVYNGNSGVTANGSANSFFESNTNNYLQLGSPETSENGILFGKPTGSASGGIIYTGTNAMNLRTGGNNTRMTILSSGNVGIGTTTPATTFEVSSTGSPYIRISDVSGGSDVGLEFFRTGAGFVDWRVRDSGGDLDFLASTDDFATTVNEYQMTTTSFSPGVTNTNSLGSASFRWTAVHATNGTIQTSDRREKENIKTLNYGLKDVLNMSPVRYTWKANPEQGQKVGLIAQEVAAIIPEVVTGLKPDGTIGEGRLGMNYAELVPVLINAIKEQQQMIDKLNNNVENMRQELASTKRELDTRAEGPKSNK